MADGAFGVLAPTIPQADPGASFRALQPELEAAVARVLASGCYVLGPEVEAFEAEFAAFLGGGSVVSCANGTDAIELALRALGVGAGAAVATVSHTAVATVAAIERAGAEACLVDTEAGAYTLDVDDLIGLVERRSPSSAPIKAVVAVHLYGQAVDLGRLVEVCRRFDLKLIEDCSQAHGASFDGRALGTFGDAGCFSFYPTKALGAFGDGGAVRAPEPALAERLRRLRQYGWDEQRVSWEPGCNSRLDELQAAVLRVKLPHLPAANARRRAIADVYDSALGGGRLLKPQRRQGATHVFHQYVVRTPERDAVRARLAEQGVGTAIHYPVPVHSHPAYRDRLALGPAGCAQTDAAAAEILSLPIHPELTDREVDAVAKVLAEL